MLKKLISIYILLIFTFLDTNAFASNTEFNKWVKKFKVEAIKSGVSKNVVNDVMSSAVFLPKVIEYICIQSYRIIIF